jgi:hypothetical protein
MRTMNRAVSFLAVLALLATTGCSSRVESGVADADSTLVYASKEADGVTARITLCRKIGSKTGRRIGVGQVFTIGEKSKVRALIDLENELALGERRLMFHLVWLGPGDREFYTKRIDHDPSDKPAPLASSISIYPGKREPGSYALQVYLFRELIAEKRFELRSVPEESSSS